MTQQIIAIDSSMLNLFMQCSWKYKLTYVDSIAATKKPDYLEKGTIMHKMLWLYYTLLKERKPFEERVSRSIEYGMLCYPDLDLKEESLDDAIYQFKEYCLYYQGENWVPVAFEQPFSIQLYEDENIKILYEGLIDLIVDISNVGLQIIDHKTQQRNSTPEDLSNQFMGYSYALQIPRVTVNRIGFQTSLKPKDRFKRDIMNYTPERLAEWRTNTVWWAKFMAILLTSNTFPMNFTSCDKYGGCWFRGICKTNPELREWEINRHYKEAQRWEPAKELEHATSR